MTQRPSYKLTVGILALSGAALVHVHNKEHPTPRKHSASPPVAQVAPDPNLLTRAQVDAACGYKPGSNTLGPPGIELSQPLLRTDLFNCHGDKAIGHFFAGTGSLSELNAAKAEGNRVLGITDPQAFDRALQLVPTVPGYRSADASGGSMPFESGRRDPQVKIPKPGAAKLADPKQ